MTQSRRYRIVTCDSGESQYRVDETSVSVPLVSADAGRKLIPGGNPLSLKTFSLEPRLINSKNEPTFNILGPEVQFLVDPAEAVGAFGLIRGVVAPGIAIPLHSHADPEVMFVLDGALEFLQHNGKAGRWLTARRGEVISIPGNVKHALRNNSSENTSLLLVTPPNIYGFFRAIASPLNPDSKSRPLTPADMERLMALSAKHNYWLASPEENAAIGLEGF